MILKKLRGNQNKIKPRGRKRKLFASTMLILRLLFGGSQSASASSNSKNVQDGVGSKAPIYRTFSRESSMIADLNQDDSTQSELVPKGDQRTIISSSGKIIMIIPRGGDNNQPGKPSKFSSGSKAKGAAKRDFARRQTGKKPTSGRSGGSFFAEAFTVEPKFPARPGGNRDGLSGRFSAQSTPDPSNPGCGGGPRSIIVLSQSKSSEQDSVREITGHDGRTAQFTDKSASHLTSNHGHSVGINDPLPLSPNQKSRKHPIVRTRINKQNKEEFGDTLEKILEDPRTQILPEISIRGIKGHGYYTKHYGGKNGFFVGIHDEGEFKGQIKKAQPVSPFQLKKLKKDKKID